MANTALAEATRTARVLVFAVDDGCFCIHLDWVEAVYQRDDAPIHTVKDADGVSRSFLIHRGQPALIVDLRDAFDLGELLGATNRAAFMVLRAGSFLLALQADACTGVRELDLRTKVPVPTSLVRDGGLSVGHLVELDGRLHGLLEPSRLLSSALREKLEPFLKEAVAFRDREDKMAVLADELRHAPTVAGLKAYGRLARRNGRTRVAGAARILLKALQEVEQPDTPGAVEAGTIAADTLVRDLVALSAARRTGELAVQLPSGESGKVFFDAGRIADAFLPGEWGRGAFKRILGAREGSYQFAATDSPVDPQRINDSALWLVLETIEQVSEERRGRHR